MSSDVQIGQGQRSYFWYAVWVGVFVGLLFGFAVSSLVSTVKYHDLREKTATQRERVVGMLPSQVKHGRFGKAPKFTGLINQNGQPINSANLAGKVQVVSFLSPYGVHTTPVLVANLRNLYQDLAQSHLLGSKVVFVSYNLDPQHADPKALSQFMHDLADLGSNDSANWQFLTGSESTIGTIVAGRYGVHYHVLDDADKAEYVERMKKTGEYDYAKAINPLAQNAPKHQRIVSHDVVFLVSPNGDIKIRINQADAYPTSRLLYEIVSMLKLPGMDKGGN